MIRHRFHVRAFCVALLLAARPSPAQEDVPEPARPFVEQAERETAAGRGAEAVKSWRLALAAAPDWTQGYVSLGALLASSGRQEEALAVFQQGLAKSPREATLLFNAAAVSLQLGKASDALLLADRARAEAPKDARAHLLRAAILRKLERKEDSLAAYQDAVRADPRSAQAYFGLGNAAHELGRNEEAADAFKKALERDASLLRAQYNLGTVLFEMGRDEEAIGAYTAALAPVEKEIARGKPVDPVNARAFANLGALYMRRRRWAPALEAYEKAQKADPKDASLDANLGFLHFQLGHDEAAARFYEKALAAGRPVPVAELHLGLIAERAGRVEEAKKRLAAALPSLELADRREAHLALSRLALRSGDAPGAESELLAVLKDVTDDAPALLTLGRLQRTSGRLAQAKETLEKARRLSKDDTQAVLELAALARQTGDSESARKLYEEALQRSAKPEELWAVRANLALSKLDGAPADAKRSLEALVKDAPAARADGAAELRGTLALLAAKEGKREEAARALRKLASEKPRDPSLQRAAAAADAAEGRAEAAAKAAGTEPYVAANRALAAWSSGRTPDEVDVQALAAAFPLWWGVSLAEGERALASGDERGAAEKLGAALEACDVHAEAPSVASAGVLAAVLGGSGAPSLCARARKLAGTALVRASLRALSETKTKGASGSGARDARAYAERALKLPLDAGARSVALFVRGTAELQLGNAAGARDGLSSALAGKLPQGLVPLARNNLGVVLARLGVGEEATRELSAARAAAPAPPEAALNLALRLDEAGRSTEALALYDEYLRSGASREDVVQRAEALRKVLR